MTVVKEDVFGFDLPITCWHCSSCPALENCPSEAVQRSSNGLVYVIEENCVGCGKCVKACVFGAIKLHPEKCTPLICDQCGGKPLCVEKCPTKALTYSKARTRPKLPSRVLEEMLRKWKIVA
jgi:carbon-monoxide dehydrogenase iron sulfur subunit